MASVRKMFSLVIVSGLFVGCVSGTNVSSTLKDCETTKNETNCLKCGPAGCMKCEKLIVFATRQCVDQCPFGHSEQWSRLVDYMGQVCFNTGHIWGLSGETFAIFVGITFGAIVCVFIIIGGIIYVRYRQQKPNTANQRQSAAMMIDSPERREFLKKLESFQPHAYTFLDIMNDTRRQIRELHRASYHADVAAYKPVVRDLAILLVLLNRPPDHITEIPNDWQRISVWAEKLLKRYKRMSDSNNSSSTQVVQLINFLQAPSSSNNTSPVRNADLSTESTSSQFTTLSTFKPDERTSLEYQNFNNKNNTNSNNDSAIIETISPTWEFPNYSLVTMGTVNWARSKEYLYNNWLDDDLLQLGYRPQDEITTEL